MVVEKDITQSSYHMSITSSLENALFGSSKTAGNKGDIYLKLLKLGIRNTVILNIHQSIIAVFHLAAKYDFPRTAGSINISQGQL